jgi:parallel beta-helix repeat protein
MRLRPALATFLGAALLSLLPASPAYGAKPVAVHCGQTITEDTTLANDLTDCPDRGIVIGADNVTLDLNGHTVDGNGLDNTVEECADFWCDTGIDNTGHHRGVTIQNGSVQDFSSGIAIEGGRDHRVRRLAVSDNGDGIDVAFATETVVTQSSFDDNVFGIWVFRSSSIRIERNSVLGYQGCGIELQRSHEMLVAGNSVSASAPGTDITGDACGIGLFNGSNLNRIERNSVSGNGFVGLIAEQSNGNELIRNDVFRNTDDVIVMGDGNTVAGNRISDALGAGDGSGFGISLDGGTGNLLADNTIERAREAGIRVFSPPDEPDLPPTVDNTLRSNVVRDASPDAILVEATATGTLLERNLAEGAGDDGIDVDSPATTLTRNTANRNHDLGIEAVPGVTDGGGNRASGNGNPLQCTNVFCK